MRSGANARRHLSRLWPCCARRARIGAGVWLAGLALSAPSWAQEITHARFTDPTEHYAHAILGDGIEYSGMMITRDTGEMFRIRFGVGTRVFEDIEPRLWDVTGDGAPEVVVIETDPAQGAQLAIYGLRENRLEKIAQTPHIGQPHRWLAPIGAADLDGDGFVEIAYIDRPHLAKTLKIWRFRDGRLEPVGDKAGLTNHRIGQDFITSGIRDCGQGVEMITADAGWRQVMATRLYDGQITTRALGPFRGRASVVQALNCP